MLLLSLKLIANATKLKQKKATIRHTRKLNETRNTWKLHKQFFIDEETMDIIVIPEEAIDEYITTSETYQVEDFLKGFIK